MKPLKFTHRPREDGTVDSICLGCFQTVAVTTDESDRETLEAAHKCSGMDLATLLNPKRRSIQFG
jgi:hypothetical protein